jgi:hypothetical protein
MKPVEHKLRQIVIGELLALKCGYTGKFERGQVKRINAIRFALLTSDGRQVAEGSAAQILSLYEKMF